MSETTLPETPASLEDSSAWLRFYSAYGIKPQHVARDGACGVCRALNGRVVDPENAPVIPVLGCTNAACRCAYMPVNLTAAQRFRESFAEQMWEGAWVMGVCFMSAPFLTLGAFVVDSARVSLPGDLLFAVVVGLVGFLLFRWARAKQRRSKPRTA